MAVSHDMLDFKKMFAETKAHAKVTLLPLRVFELVVSQKFSPLPVGIFQCYLRFAKLLLERKI
jgi:hypothetical protein